MTVRDRQQHGQAIAIDAHRDAARVAAETRIGQHLQFDQQRTRPWRITVMMLPDTGSATSMFHSPQVALSLPFR